MSVVFRQVRAARALISWTQDELATAAKIGVATLRRYEGGAEIGELHVDAITRALEAAGIIFLHGGFEVDGRPIGFGVALEKRNRRSSKG